ncbi:MAG: asparagine synthase (glutamine-hydrolyzing) [Patescibacteria group bacterium]
MCGINGFTFHDPDALRRMHGATHHRGPDADGFFEDGKQISLAHNRLSIIDLSEGGRQPMTTQDGRFTIVFNGEIYNYRELRHALEKQGVVFRSVSDTEVLLQAFATWGEACLAKLNGVFAFAIWDRDRAELFLARDPVGVKPLYYHWHAGRLIFSSEIKAILTHPDVARTINLDALNLYFRFLYVPGPRTMFEGIWKLSPGHLLRVHGGQMEIRRWWSLEEGAYLQDRRAATEDVRRCAGEAVKRQLVSDRPLGVFLSGGIDSTSVLALMREAQPSGKILTFSVGYEQTEEADKYNADAILARKTAQHFGTEHHELTLSGRDVAGCFEKIAWHMDEPVSNHIQPSTYLLAQFSQPQITVALGGDGGDEVFGGYERYWWSAFIDRVRSIPAPLRPAWLLHATEKIAGRQGFADKVDIPPGFARFFSFIGQKPEQAKRFLAQEVRRSSVGEQAFAPHFQKHWKDFTNQFMATDFQTWLPDESLVRSDKLTMAHGLEERVPLLDLELVRLGYQIPSAWKLGKRGKGKRIFVDALRPLLPPHVLEARKQGFFSPAAKWLRGDLLTFARESLSDSYAPGSTAYVDLAEGRRALEDHVAKRAYGLNQVWALMTFQAWYRQFFC